MSSLLAFFSNWITHSMPSPSPIKCKERTINRTSWLITFWNQSAIKPKTKGFNVKEATDACFRYLTDTIAVSNCRPKRISNQITQCTCMHFLAEPEEEHTAMSVAEYIDRFSGMTLQTKRELVLEWLKVSALMEGLDPRNQLTTCCLDSPLARRRRDHHDLQECDRKPAF